MFLESEQVTDITPFRRDSFPTSSTLNSCSTFIHHNPPVSLLVSVHSPSPCHPYVDGVLGLPRIIWDTDLRFGHLYHINPIFVIPVRNTQKIKDHPSFTGGFTDTYIMEYTVSLKWYTNFHGSWNCPLSYVNVGQISGFRNFSLWKSRYQCLFLH